MSSSNNAFQWLFDALKAINDNLYTLSENMAETDAKIARIEEMINQTAEPISSNSARKKKREEETT